MNYNIIIVQVRYITAEKKKLPVLGDGFPIQDVSFASIVLYLILNS